MYESNGKVFSTLGRLLPYNSYCEAWKLHVHIFQMTYCYYWVNTVIFSCTLRGRDAVHNLVINKALNLSYFDLKKKLKVEVKIN